MFKYNKTGNKNAIIQQIADSLEFATDLSEPNRVEKPKVNIELLKISPLQNLNPSESKILEKRVYNSFALNKLFADKKFIRLDTVRIFEKHESRIDF